eukprot:TRINITY_DN5586_c1_g1_i8.p1 TRINITY_DN5586_c1_g1~~TRINITY_DN5586_c1_g1_i8.p1  ORF type:complete len:836 (+),score=174.70 TRINITY_DN5586_c1_g1_i8:78-2585(+)
MRRLAAVVAAVGGSWAAPTGGAFHFSAGFTDDMVLQRSPARAAVYGWIDPGVNAPRVAINVNGQDADGKRVAYTVEAAVTYAKGQPQAQQWKALLHPAAAGGEYSITVASADSDDPAEAMIQRVTFGDVWFCSGQSNMALETYYTFSALDAQKEIASGKYTELRHFMFGAMGLKYLSLSPEWVTENGSPAQDPDYVWHNVSWSAAQPSTDKAHSAFARFAATCMYFGMGLVDQRAKRQVDVGVPIGLIQSAIGGSQIESWISNETLRVCAGAQSGGGAAPATQLWYGMVTPFVNMTVNGWVWYQGENNVYGVTGNVATGMGYGCELAAMVREWRGAWSAQHGTTDPLAPFGVVTLAGGTSEGNGEHMAAFRWSQTGNYGHLPSPALPNTFLAQVYDLSDPWAFVSDGDPARDKHHCALPDPKTGQYGAECSKWDSSAWAPALRPYLPLVRNNSPSGIAGNNFMDGIHPRLKRPVGTRLAQAYMALRHGGTATGPTLSGCTVRNSSMQLHFNETLLAGDSVSVRHFDANMSNWDPADSLGLMVCAAPKPGKVPSGCREQCVYGGYCNEGDSSCCQQPSCAFGCSFAELTSSLSECEDTCKAAHSKCSFSVQNRSFEMCAACPKSSRSCSRDCGGASIGACLLGCRYAHKAAQPTPWPPANATNCACASWGSVKCDPPDSWPCDPYFNPGSAYWYCEVGPGWKPPEWLRRRSIAAPSPRDFASAPERWTQPRLGAEPPGPMVMLWRSARLSSASTGTAQVDLTPFAGEEILSVRYAWSLGDSGDTCCPGRDVAQGLAPCIPSSCPLLAKSSQLPANPFFATVGDGKCHCMAPQQCSA